MSMQIVEKSGEGLSRVYGVTIPAKDLSERLEARIVEIAPQMNIKGFRPGKVPVAHVRRVHGKALMAEVVQESINESTQKVLDDNKIRPAGEPELKPEGDFELVMDGKADLAFEMAVEIMPDFEPVDFATIALKRPVYEPTPKEVDEAVEELAAQNKTYEPRTGKSLKAKDGDQVVIDFLGKVDGVAFEGGAAEGADLTLGPASSSPVLKSSWSAPSRVTRLWSR